MKSNSAANAWPLAAQCYGSQILMDEVNVRTISKVGKVMSVLLLLAAGHVGMANAGVGLGATRVIYPADQKQVTLGVSNNDEKSTYLIQSWVENADGQKDGRLIITPPLYLMQGKKRTRCALLMRLIKACRRIGKACSGLTSKRSPHWTNHARMRTPCNWLLPTVSNCFIAPMG